MQYLLDTHIWLWMLGDPDKLPPGMRLTIEDDDTSLFLSAASLWEISIKQQLGKLRLPHPDEAFFHDRMLRTRVQPLEISMRHALIAGRLPPHHRDPFDRMLVAQAQSLDLPILSVDNKLAHYEVQLIAD